MSSTDRIYNNIREDFMNWCAARAIVQPASLERIAEYLAFCGETKGVSTVRQRLAAIADLYRQRGYQLDTRAYEIQDVLARFPTPVRSTRRSADVLDAMVAAAKEAYRLSNKDMREAIVAALDKQREMQ